MKETERVVQYYETYDEDGRLDRGEGKLEFIRSKTIISRHLRQQQMDVLDIGGATGRYAFWLADLDHHVHLVDTTPKHIKVATLRNRQRPKQLASIRNGDARDLPYDNDAFDLVLLMGPMYHLQNYGDRHKVLLECKRVLRHSVILITSYISRFASLLCCYHDKLYVDTEYRDIVYEDLVSGKHRGSADGSTNYFTSAYLHHPEQIEKETEEAGFKMDELVSIESFGWLVDWESQFKVIDPLLAHIAAIEGEKSLIGIGPHIMQVCHKFRTRPIMLKKYKI